MRYLDYCWLVMGKSPEPGKVKTRMQPHLSPEMSANLQAALSCDVLQRWQLANLCPLRFWLGGNADVFQKKVLQDIEGDFPISPQVVGDLGQRMSAAITHAFDNGSQGVIVTGTDCPFMDTCYIEQALLSLEQGIDIVVGPAMDGGYVLIGMNRLYPEVFQNISWGGEHVFTQTRQAIEALNLKALYLLKNI